MNAIKNHFVKRQQQPKNIWIGLFCYLRRLLQHCKYSPVVCWYEGQGWKLIEKPNFVQVFQVLKLCLDNIVTYIIKILRFALSAANSLNSVLSTGTKTQQNSLNKNRFLKVVPSYDDKIIYR